VPWLPAYISALELSKNVAPDNMPAPARDLQQPPRDWWAAVSGTPRGGIGVALLLRVVLFSTLVTLVLTVLQLSLSYRSERARLEARFGEIEQATARSLAENLWAVNTRQIEEQLDGIVRLPSIRGAEVRDTGGSGRPISVFRGQHQADGVAKEYPLACCGAHPETIGMLRIEATLEEIYRDIAAQAVVILLSNAAKTFLVAFFILFVVHQLATRHLLDIAASARDVSLEGEGAPLRLRRARGENDELDQLVEALNGMRERLARQALELRNADARMAAILDNMPDLAWMKDVEGRFTAVNRAFAAAKGFGDPREMLGKTDLDVHPLDLARSYRSDDADVMASHGTRRVEEQHARADGSIGFIETIKDGIAGCRRPRGRHGGHRTRHHRAPPGRGRPRSAPRGRNLERGQECLPGAHEPRDPHAAQRCDRHDGPLAGHSARRATSALRRTRQVVR